ncbi:MAG: hypothetical protein HOF61_11535, partial [Verrucomicrobia bacterium]|nr:hypothetical protein [Verrucomicrobiota bacterium]
MAKRNDHLRLWLVSGRGLSATWLSDVDKELSTGEAAPEPTVVTIDETLTSERLDRYLTTRLPHISRG